MTLKALSHIAAVVLAVAAVIVQVLQSDLPTVLALVGAAVGANGLGHAFGSSATKVPPV